MEKYDDVLFASEQSVAERPQTPEFDPEAFKERKQEERDKVYGMIDTAAVNLAEPDKLREYLDIQARFDLYRPGNILLIQTQMPMATRLKSYDDWKAQGAGVKKDQHHITILKSGKQYTRDDGTIGQYTDIKKVFDISQTYGTRKPKAPTFPEGRILLKALMHDSPVPAKAADNLPDTLGAYYDPNAKVIYVRPGMDAPDIFRCMSAELAHAELARSLGEDYNRENTQFTAYCVSYVLCREYGVDVSSFNFEHAPTMFSDKEPQEIRAELSNIREAAGEIGGRMKEAIQQERAAKEPKDTGDR